MGHVGKSNGKVSAGFQGAAFFVTFFVLSLFFAGHYRVFRTHDQQTTLAENTSNLHSVGVGLHISHFSTFDIPKNQFILDGTIWFLFDPTVTSLETVTKFDIINGSLLKRAEPVVTQFEDRTLAQFRIRAEFHAPLNYRMFPFDDHKVFLRVSNRFLPPDTAFSATSSDVNMSNDLFLQGWRIRDLDAKSGVHQVILHEGLKRYADEQQEVVFTFDCERTDPSIIINMLLTLLLMLFISMLTFSSSEDSVLIVTVGMVALIGYRNVMQTMAPAKVSYFIYSDFLYLFAVVGIIITLFAGIMTQDNGSSIRIKKGLIIGIYTLFVSACIITSLIF